MPSPEDFLRQLSDGAKAPARPGRRVPPLDRGHELEQPAPPKVIFKSPPRPEPVSPPEAKPHTEARDQRLLRKVESIEAAITQTVGPPDRRFGEMLIGAFGLLALLVVCTSYGTEAGGSRLMYFVTASLVGVWCLWIVSFVRPLGRWIWLGLLAGIPYLMMNPWVVIDRPSDSPLVVADTRWNWTSWTYQRVHSKNGNYRAEGWMTPTRQRHGGWRIRISYEGEHRDVFNWFYYGEDVETEANFRRLEGGAG